MREPELICDICGGDPEGSCVCPECEACGVAGDPACVGTHMPAEAWPRILRCANCNKIGVYCFETNLCLDCWTTRVGESLRTIPVLPDDDITIAPLSLDMPIGGLPWLS